MMKLTLALMAGLAAAQTPPPPPAASPVVLPPLLAPPADPNARRDWLKAQLDEIFSAKVLGSAKVSILVAELDTPKPIYARDEKVGLNAASNVKLLTSAAALSRLGPEFRFRTSVYGPPKGTGRWLGAGGEFTGDLYVKGSGDPTLTAQDLAGLAGDLAALGVRKVKGALVIDATYFDANSSAPAFDQKTESAAFRAPSSAASLDGNAIAVTVIPSQIPGAPARIVIEPSSPYVVVQGRVTTAAADGPAVPQVETEDAGDGHTRVLLSGRIRRGTEPRRFLRRIVHPELFFGHALREALKRRGITVDQPLRFEAMPENLRALASHDSAPLAVVLHDLNKRSSNFAAEQVLRTLGAEVVGKPGTWDKGLEATARWLQSAGIPRTAYRMTNGSGLYDSNRFSAEQIVIALRATLRDFRIASEYLASLAVAGTDGTLGQRLSGTAAARFVRAKTGSLATASCLSGIAGAPGQRPLLFSFLINDIANPADARAAQDRAAVALVMYLDPTAAPQTPAGL